MSGADEGRARRLGKAAMISAGLLAVVPATARAEDTSGGNGSTGPLGVFREIASGIAGVFEGWTHHAAGASRASAASASSERAGPAQRCECRAGNGKSMKMVACEGREAASLASAGEPVEKVCF